MLTPAWKPLRYHAEHSAIWKSTARIIEVDAGRGSGKTEIARRKIVRYLPVRKPWPDPRYCYILPTADQARRVAWRKLKQLIPSEWWDKNLGGEKLENVMYIKTIFGSELHVVGADRPERIEGEQYDGAVVDEASDQKPGLVTKTLMPALTHRKGWLMRVGVPKRRGPGAAEFREACEKYRRRPDGTWPDPDHQSYTWPSWTVLSQEELAVARRTLTPEDFDEQFGAHWGQTTGLCFPRFSPATHVDENAVYHPDMPIYVGSDFNVDPMAWVLCHVVVDDNTLEPVAMWVFDEIFIRGTNTPNTLDYLYSKYGQHPGGWVFQGDATSKSRKTSAVVSDYLHIVNDKRFKPKRVEYADSNPAVLDRFAATNAVIMNAAGQARIKIHPRCRYLIQDLGSRYYLEGTSIPGDDKDPTHTMGHITDALGYVIWNQFPLDFEDDDDDDYNYAPSIITPDNW